MADHDVSKSLPHELEPKGGGEEDQVCQVQLRDSIDEDTWWTVVVHIPLYNYLVNH